jgi:large subunit ribosomal protein L25
MAEMIINADVRNKLGKHSKALRREGKIPGIYYGHGEPNIPVAMTELVLRPLYKTSHTHVINLNLSDGSKKMCILRDIQFDPLTDRPIHFDLYGLKEHEELTISVPVVLKGSPKGVKDGGLLQQVLHKVKISCLPKHIPDQIEINVEELDMNQSIHVRDINVPNVQMAEQANGTICAVIPPTVIKEPTPVDTTAIAAETVAEPEVIGKGKKIEEGEAPEEKEKDKEKEKEKKK